MVDLHVYSRDLIDFISHSKDTFIVGSTDNVLLLYL